MGPFMRLSFFTFQLSLIFTSIAFSAVRGAIVSSAWREPNVTMSLTDRLSTTEAALQKAVGVLNTTNQFNGQTYETVGRVYTQMAEFDKITSQRMYEDSLQQYFSQTAQVRANFSDPLTYGYAAIRAYAAYQNPVFLTYAIDSWSFGQAYTISSTSESVVGKNLTIEDDCQGTTMAGATFWTTKSTDSSVTAMSTGYFLVVSALLAEATGDPMYLTAAEQSADFITAHMCTPDPFVLQTISANQSDSCAILDKTTNSFNTGLFIEGLAVLAAITKNMSRQALLDDLITAALSSAPWQTSAGIIASGASKQGDSLLVRALAAAYARNATTLDIRTSVHDYLGVQFNAVVDLATAGGNNIYSAQWTGPPSLVFSLANQVNALGALLGGALLEGNSSNASVTSSGTVPSASGSASPSSTTRTAHAQAGIIAGSVVGVLVLLLGAGGVWLWLRRRRPRRPTPARLEISPNVSTFAGSLGYAAHNQLNENSAPPPAVARASIAKPLQNPPQQYGGYTFSYPSAAAAPTASSPSSAPLSATNAVWTPSSYTNSARVISPVDLPTADLVVLLNERLQDRPVDQHESPPEYAVREG
ncbi:hypothetical protein FB451DRAFT_1368658 [Mycena latifolia]|nr:hypothetical protein FB451DRAFT_1368658 [Mycena latifolia]